MFALGRNCTGKRLVNKSCETLYCDENSKSTNQVPVEGHEPTVVMAKPEPIVRDDLMCEKIGTEKLRRRWWISEDENLNPFDRTPPPQLDIHNYFF